ncbi:lysophospholipase L1-like esterase [Serratia fonticola]|uniref:Lysophospholipase L1-like esterase n=1 Tax=Serratia fonticola TaxID=47917 RepID=A0A542D876_SERFO|nr:GDSL-type esterase/lipase family protein [Serratia fonticola]TQI78689.1 lysophospholipase L1-like esterase [Serratia fonticola]TQI99289.1 lysophospholipase L1-like esterase [Serratia fonticola]TVZ68814.1 lysophospholipase L1-like esterase [Serratia fonticola]
MAKINEQSVWEPEIYRLTTEAAVLGFNADDNSDGPSNVQGQQLANRTLFLRDELTAYNGLIKSGELPFTSVAQAQAAINSGKIINGGIFSVRSEDLEVWAAEYINSNGIATPTGKVLSSDEVVRRSNLLFDSFNEYSSKNITFGNWDWYSGATPTFSLSDKDLPLTTPVIKASGITSFDKFYDLTQLPISAGDTMTFSIIAWFQNTGGKFHVFFLDSTRSQLSVTSSDPLTSGIVAPNLVCLVPSGAVSVRIRVQNTIDGSFKIGAYAAALGRFQAEFSRSIPSKSQQDALGTPTNIVYDPFNEMLSVRPKQGLPAGVVDAMSYAGILIKNSSNSPWGKNGIQAAVGANADRILALSSLGVMPGDIITVRVAAFFSAVNGAIQIFCRNQDGVLSSTTLTAKSSGFADKNSTLTIPDLTTYITVRVSGAMMKELLAIAIAVGKSVPEYIYGSLPAEYSGYQRQQPNLWPDPWFRRYETGETQIDGYGPAVVAGVANPAYVADYIASPFARKKSLIIPVGGGQTDINISASRLGLKAGDSLTITLGVVAAQAINLAAYFRTSTGTVISSSASQQYQFPSMQYQQLVKAIDVTQEIADTADYLQVRVMNGQTVGAAGVYIVARGIFVGNSSPVLCDDTYNDDSVRIIANSPTINANTLRETHKRLMHRKLNQSATLVTAHIGDSWTHLWNRWSGIFAGKMQADFGSAGIGYIGFGYPSDSAFGQYNGNVLGQITLTKTGAWTPNYASTESADICSVSSSDTAATFRVNGVPASASSVRLFAKPKGIVQYSTNGGADWTQIDLSAFSNVAIATLTVPTTAFNIWFQPVTSVEIYGLDVQTTTDGVRCHKLGATGSSAQQWAAQVTKAAWQTSLTALAPNLVTILHGTNDQTSSRNPSAFAADIQTIITAVRAACPLSDVLVMMPAENQRNNAVPMAAYASVVRDVCAKNKVAFHNLQANYGDAPPDYASTSQRAWFNVDGIHPDPATGGGLPIVAAMMKLVE